MKREVGVDRERKRASPALLHDAEPIVAAEQQESQLVAVLQPVIDATLVVPIDGHDAGDAPVGIVGDEEREEDVDVAPARGERDLRARVDRSFDEGDRFDQIERSLSVDAGGVALAGADVDGPGQVAPVHGAIAARIEVDAIEQLLVDDGGAAEEVVELRNPVSVEIGARILRRAPADEERSAEERRPRQAGQVLHRADGIVEAAGNVHQLVVRERAPRGGVVRFLPRNGRLEVTDGGPVQPDAARLDGAVLDDHDVDLTGVEARRRHRQRAGTGRRLERVSPLRVRDGLGSRIVGGFRTGNRPAGTRLHHGAVDRPSRSTARLLHELLLDDEVIDVANPDCRRLAVDLRRRETEAPDGLDRRGIEVRRDGLLDHDLRHGAMLVDVDAAGDVGGLSAREALGRVGRGWRLEELRQPGQLGRDQQRNGHPGAMRRIGKCARMAASTRSRA